MTETVQRPDCKTLVASPLDAGSQLVCFLSPHPTDPWHYDNRGLGVWFREVPGGIDARVGLTRHPELEDSRPADRHTLPVLWTDAVGRLDVDTMRELAPRVRAGLIDALRSAATAVRAGRGTVVVPEDTYDLVRRTTAAGEVLRQWRDVFDAAAKEADAITEEEALTAMGSLPGYDEAPSGSLFVPDGAGQRIAVTPDWKAGESTWDLDSLKGWLAEDTVAEQGVGIDGDTAVFTPAETVSLIRDGLDRLTGLGVFSPRVTPLDALRRKLAEQGRDADAGLLRQIRSVGLRKYQGVKITREETKK